MPDASSSTQTGATGPTPSGNGQFHDEPFPYYDPWADPEPPEFPGGVLPQWMEDTIIDVALRDGIDFSLQAMGYLAAFSGAHTRARGFARIGDRPGVCRR